MNAAMLQDSLNQLMANRAASIATPAAPKKKRKRGGLAGIWDRNKHIIKPVVSGALGLVPGAGPALAAGAGALMGGLDREGKGGIGFDVGGGLRGGVSGFAAGGVANMGKAALTGGANWFGAAKTAGSDYLNNAGLGAGKAAIDPTSVVDPVSGVARTVPGSPSIPAGALRTAGRRAMKFANTNPVAVGMGLNTAGQMMASNQQMAMSREQLDWDRELFNRREADRQRLAESLRPLFLSLQNRLGGN